jgi:AraC-like DNA-binding protein
MSAETISPAAGLRPWNAHGGATPHALRSGAGFPPAVGILADGTPFYAPIGEVVVNDDALVVCHLCGRSLRSVTAHLRVHGWVKEAYCQAFGLERGQSLESQQTRKLRAAALTARLVFDPAIRAGSAAGRERARAGDLARDAAAAASGRTLPEQRRRKVRRALASIPPDQAARANSARARRHRAEVAADAARQAGYPDIGALVLARVRAGVSLAVISRDAGLHKDWLSRHLGDIDPAAAAVVRQLRAGQREAEWDGPWQPALSRLGFPDVRGWLQERHIMQNRTVNAIASEVGFSHHAVRSALRRHELEITTHAAKRHSARQRAHDVAAAKGFATIGGYISRRRAEGWSWKAISADCSQPQTWLRRQAAQPEIGGRSDRS